MNFLCSIADNSDRPAAQLKIAMAAMGHLFHAVNHSSITEYKEVHMLVTALIKSSTTRSRPRSKVIPFDPFKALFHTWPGDSLLDIDRLRMKCLTLLAFVLMLRPSDVAPNAVWYDAASGIASKQVFSTEDIIFLDTGDAKITIHGNKNDTDRSGFQVHVPKSADVLCDPVSCLKMYIQRTEAVRPPTKPVFLPLRPPYKQLAGRTVAQILNGVIALVGLKGQYTAKDFRPSGATAAIAQGYDPETVMKLGRWKTRSVFFDHYVHSVTPADYVDKVCVL